MSEPDPIRDTRKADHVYAEACALLPALRAVARAKGYALAYHGSFARDIDLLAAPWTPTAVDAHELAEAIRSEAAVVTGKEAFWLNYEQSDPNDFTRRNPQSKPHGRLGWSIHLCGTGTYLDLSVMPRQTAADLQLAELTP